jgi:hypothetical protein
VVNTKTALNKPRISGENTVPSRSTLSLSPKRRAVTNKPKQPNPSTMKLLRYIVWSASSLISRHAYHQSPPTTTLRNAFLATISGPARIPRWLIANALKAVRKARARIINQHRNERHGNYLRDNTNRLLDGRSRL